MKTNSIFLTAIFLLLAVARVPATMFYVNVSNTVPIAPYTNWPTAATNIQDAIDVAIAGDTVTVTNGIYSYGGRSVNGNALTNRVSVTKPLILQSVNGPSSTVIQGYQLPVTNTGNSAVRCVYLTNGAALIGFTLIGGATRAVSDGSADGIGGGVWCESTNANLVNCLIVSNVCGYGAGGAYWGTLIDCVLSNNIALQGRGFGGAAWNSTLIRCSLVGNIGYTSTADASILADCFLFANNRAVSGCIANNCTIAYNNGSTANNCHLTNCIVYGNSGSIAFYSTYSYCCLNAPLTPGIGNFTNAPNFIDPMNGNFHLQSNSPCINAGKNSYVTTTNDLDANPRIVGGTVDIGCYEFQTPSSTLSYAWAQQYGLPTDGSADFTDTDGDGMNNWQEWIAGLIPTNAVSVLLLNAPTNVVTGLKVSWQSVNTRTYYLQRSANLPAFTALQSNLVGQANATSYTDTSATNGGSYFYRVGVQ